MSSDEKAAISNADRAKIRRFVDYVTTDGFSVDAMVTRMRRLKFETIVTGKSYTEVLAAPEEPSGIDDLPTTDLQK